jgi:NAD(P)-dependent dehydrogenase (short-subunit alcohol dehydrogenase family)
MGARVVAADRDTEGLRHFAAATESLDLEGAIEVCELDVSSPESWQSCVQSIMSTQRRVDVLYNNAAVFLPEDRGIDDTPLAIWDRVMAVNARGVYLGCRAVVPAMKAQMSGSIINVVSIRAYLGTTVPQDVYAASKGAVVALTKSLSSELGAWQIRCNAIAPGTIETPMASAHDASARQRRIQRYPLGRFGEVDDVVGAAAFFASSSSSWITGTVLPVDGGASVLYV